MDQIDLRDAIMQCIEDARKPTRLTKAKFSESLGHYQAWISQLSYQKKLKNKTIENVAQCLPIVFRCDHKNRKEFRTFKALTDYIGDISRKHRLDNGISVIANMEKYGTGYQGLEYKHKLCQNVVFEVAQDLGIKIYVGLSKEIQPGQDAEPVEVPLPVYSIPVSKVKPGNGKVLHGFNGW